MDVNEWAFKPGHTQAASEKTILFCQMSRTYMFYEYVPIISQNILLFKLIALTSVPHVFLMTMRTLHMETILIQPNGTFFKCGIHNEANGRLGDFQLPGGALENV